MDPYIEQCERKRKEAELAIRQRHEETTICHGRLHFLLEDRTESSWIYSMAFQLRESEYSVVGTATIHYPCEEFHKVKVFMATHLVDALPSTPESVREIVAAILCKLSIPESEPWKLRWYDPSDGGGYESERDPFIFT